MARKHSRSGSSHSRGISRRKFIKLAAMTGLLAGCRPLEKLVTPTLRQPEIIRFYPDGPSKVVHTHHVGVWDGDDLVPAAIRQMFEASILMSFDPVAHDTVGLQMFSQLLTDDGGNPAAATGLATPWLENGAELGLGTNDLDNIEWVEVSLG